MSIPKPEKVVYACKPVKSSDCLNAELKLQYVHCNRITRNTQTTNNEYERFKMKNKSLCKQLRTDTIIRRWRDAWWSISDHCQTQVVLETRKIWQPKKKSLTLLSFKRNLWSSYLMKPDRSSSQQSVCGHIYSKSIPKAGLELSIPKSSLQLNPKN